MSVAASDPLRRGFASTVANWQLTLVGVAERIAIVLLTIFTLFIAVMPLVIAGLVSASQWKAAAPDEFVRDFFHAHPFITAYVLLVIGVVFIPAMIVYAWFEAGKGATLLTADEAAPRGSEQREAFRAFDFNAWLAAAARHWWATFLILNIVWAIVLAIVLVPLAVAAVVALASGGSGSGLAVGCAFASLAVLVMIALSIVANAWSQLAILERIASGCGATEACRRSYRQMRGNFADVAVTALALVCIAFGTIIALVALQWSLSFLAHVPGVGITVVPVQIAVSIVQSAVGAFLSVWATATFAALRRRSVAELVASVQNARGVVI